MIGHIASRLWDLRHDKVVQHLNDHHGIKRNDSTYIKLVCMVKAYGERDDLMADRNLGWHLGRGNSGMLLDLKDIRCRNPFRQNQLRFLRFNFGFSIIAATCGLRSH